MSEVSEEGYLFLIKNLTASVENLERDRARLIEALRPFAKFVFGPRWGSHDRVREEGDVVVLCGYDADGKTTGVNIKYSDFVTARALLSEMEK